MKKLKVAHWGGKHIAYLPFYVALYMGYFEELGLEIGVEPSGNDDEVFKKVVSGKADIAIADPTFVARKENKKANLKVISALVNNVATWGYTAHPEINSIKEVHDFASLRFAVFSKPSTSFSLISNIKSSNKQKLKSMEIIEAGISNLTSLIDSDKADIILEIEPMVSFAEEKGLKVVLALKDFYSNFLYTGIVAKQKLIDEKEDIIQNFVSAIQKALSFCEQSTKELLPVAKRLFPALSEQCLLNAIIRMKKSNTWPTEVVVNLLAWDNALKLRYEIGDIKAIKDNYSYLEQSFAYKAILGRV